MTERRTMEVIERVERLCMAAKNGHEYEASYVEQWDDLRLLVSLAKRAVREPSDRDMILPCDVNLPPATVIRKGCKLSTLIEALAFRGMVFEAWQECGE